MATVYLTVDDAPSAALGSKVDRLREHGVPALLFCEGRRLDANPTMAREAIEAGYHLGNHLYSHPEASALTVDEFRDELQRTEALIDAAYDDAGVERPARLFRFPYGDQGGDTAAAFQDVLAERGFRPPRTADRVATGDSVGAEDSTNAGDSANAGNAVPVENATLAVDAVEGTWTAGDLDWSWTSHVEDWTVETTGEIRDGLAEIDEQLDGDGNELFLFHDAPTDVELFVALLEGCENYDVDFGDPLALVDW